MKIMKKCDILLKTEMKVLSISFMKGAAFEMKKRFKQLIISTVIMQMFIILGCMTGCAAKTDDITRQEQLAQNQTQYEQLSSSQVQSDTEARNTGQTLSDAGEQISVDDAKTAALTDAGLIASDVNYTKEKLDYEDGIAVYDIEFYTSDAEYGYEINAVTGAVYSKDVDVRHARADYGHQNENGQNDIGAEQAKSIALAQAGFAEAEVTLLQCEFDVDDGQTVYEVEFIKDGREYEYKISAVDGSVLSCEMD